MSEEPLYKSITDKSRTLTDNSMARKAPRPSTLDHEPYTSNPRPYTPNPTSRAPDPKPQTFNPQVLKALTLARIWHTGSPRSYEIQDLKALTKCRF